MDQRVNNTRINQPAQLEWNSVAEIPGFPFDSFEELQAAVRIKSFNIGVDPLAAAQWSDSFNTKSNKVVIAMLSGLLILSPLAAVVAAFVLGEYWLLLALPDRKSTRLN